MDDPRIYFSANTGGFYTAKTFGGLTRFIPDPEQERPMIAVPDDSVERPDDASDNWAPPLMDVPDTEWVHPYIISDEPNPDHNLPGDAVEISPDLHLFLMAAQDEGKEIRANNDGMPIAVDPALPALDEYRTMFCARVDAQAEAARTLFLTPGSGQAMTYQEKEREADAILQDASPDPDNYPMLTAMIGFDGDTLEEVAETIRARRSEWLVIGAEIERIRTDAKHRIKEATTHEEIDTVLTGLTWPSPSDA